jgi:hypothetical protein
MVIPIQQVPRHVFLQALLIDGGNIEHFVTFPIPPMEGLFYFENVYIQSWMNN